MPKQTYDALIKDGTHMAQDASGLFLGSLLDNSTKGLSGQARFVPVTSYSGSEVLGAGLIGAAVMGIGVAIASAVNSAKQNKKEQDTVSSSHTDVRPDSVAKTIGGKKRYVSTGKYAVPTLTKRSVSSTYQVSHEQENIITAAELSKTIDYVINDYRIDSSNPEIQERLIRVMSLSMVLAKEIRELVNTCRKENKSISVDLNEWQQTMEKLTTENIGNAIVNILEQHPDMWKDNAPDIDMNTSQYYLSYDDKISSWEAIKKQLEVKPEYATIDVVKYCSKCGNKIENISQVKFCMKCGNRI